MNDSVAAYRRALPRRLKCGRADKQRCLARFDQSLALFLEETPDPSAAQLEDAFGPPEQLARAYLKELPAEQLKRHRRHRCICVGVLAVLLCGLIAWNIYKFLRPDVITVEEEIIIIDQTEEE